MATINMDSLLERLYHHRHSGEQHIFSVLLSLVLECKKDEEEEKTAAETLAWIHGDCNPNATLVLQGAISRNPSNAVVRILKRRLSSIHSVPLSVSRIAPHPCLRRVDRGKAPHLRGVK